MSDLDQNDLDFTFLADEGAPVAPVRETPTASEEDESVIGAQALDAQGFHVVAAQRRTTPSESQVVLVVDDDLATAELAARALRRAGLQAAVAGSPREAARLMGELGAPGLVLLDIEMPGMNGFEFLARMRASRRLKETPVILFTALSERRHVVRGLLAGADGYVAKPITGAALVAAVKTVLAV